MDVDRIDESTFPFTHTYYNWWKTNNCNHGRKRQAERDSNATLIVIV